MSPDREMLLSPLTWPAWPWLPMKRSKGHGWPDFGRVYADDTTAGEPVRLFDGAGEPASYKDVDALLDDGWRVD